MNRLFRSFFIASLILLMPLVLFAQGISGTWATESSTGLTPRTLLSSSVVGEGGSIYVIGGISEPGVNELNTLEIFDPYKNIWMTPSTTGTFVGRSSHTSSVVSDKIYIIGGWVGNARTKDVSVFDATSNSWTTLITTGTFTPRELLTSSVIDRKIFVIGGADNIGSYPTLDILDPSTNTWYTPTTSGTFTPRYGLCSSVVGGKIYVIGGINTKSQILNTLEVFDPLTNTWSTPATTGTFTPRRYLTSSVIDNKIYVIGGVDSTENVCNTVEVFDPATNTWTTPTTTGTFTPRCYLASSSVGGKIFAIGGTSNNAIWNTNEVFTPTSVNNAKPNATSPNITLSPNPTTGIITIQNTQGDMLHLTITNILGETVKLITNPHSSNFTIDLSKFAPGIYYAKFVTPNSVIVKKIILQ